jgi:hypothetical protein
MRYPKSWNEVNLAQLHELDLLRQRTDLDAEEIMNQVLSVLSNQHIEEIEKQPHTERIAAYRKLTFLNEYPSKKPKRKRFKLDGKWYRIVTNPAEVSAGEYATLQVVAAGGKFIENMHQVIACLMIEQERKWFRWVDIRYDKSRSAAEFQRKAQKIMQKMPVGQAYPYALFFSNLLPELLKASLTYFQKQEKKLRKQAATG